MKNNESNNEENEKKNENVNDINEISKKIINDQ